MEENHNNHAESKCKQSSFVLTFIMYCLGQAYLTWTYQENEDSDLDNGPESARHRKRRLQGELARALAVLGIKPSTFHSLVNRKQISELKQLLDLAIKDRTEDYVQRKHTTKAVVKTGNKEFNLDLEVTDMSTVHEAFQFLVRKFVETNEGLDDGLVSGLDTLETRKKRESTFAELELMDSSTSLVDQDSR